MDGDRSERDHLDRMTCTIGFDEPPQAFNALLNGAIRGRVVVNVGRPLSRES
jgi:NADPH-dependent curcumin reductase CurA